MTDSSHDPDRPTYGTGPAYPSSHTRFDDGAGTRQATSASPAKSSEPGAHVAAAGVEATPGEPSPPEPTEQREAGEPQPAEGAGAAAPEAPTEPEPQDPEAAHEAPGDAGPAPEHGDRR